MFAGGVCFWGVDLSTYPSKFRLVLIHYGLDYDVTYFAHFLHLQEYAGPMLCKPLVLWLIVSVHLGFDMFLLLILSLATSRSKARGV